MRCMADVKIKRTQTEHPTCRFAISKGGGVRLGTLEKGTPPALAVTHYRGYITGDLKLSRGP